MIAESAALAVTVAGTERTEGWFSNAKGAERADAITAALRIADASFFFVFFSIITLLLYFSHAMHNSVFTKNWEHAVKLRCIGIMK